MLDISFNNIFKYTPIFPDSINPFTSNSFFQPLFGNSTITSQLSNIDSFIYTNNNHYYNNLYNSYFFMPNINIPSFNSYVFPTNNNWNINFDSFMFPKLNTSNPSISKPKTTYTPTLTSTKSTRTKTTTTSIKMTYKQGKFDLNFWKSQGYNHDTGIKLAKDAVTHCPGHADHGCVGYTRDTLNRIYHTNFQKGKAGRACNFGNHILLDPRLNGKFKKVSKDLIAKYGCPDGAIVLWNGGTPGLNGDAVVRRCGHGGIEYNGINYSDIKFGHLDTCKEVWIPVTSV